MRPLTPREYKSGRTPGKACAFQEGALMHQIQPLVEFSSPSRSDEEVAWRSLCRDGGAVSAGAVHEGQRTWPAQPFTTMRAVLLPIALRATEGQPPQPRR
ncbi:MAG: hypothetical protein DCF28_11460 [Alphaproteobacteria bacterium]|nr:MAG: hypothetical protein DCF28_11460 [Alphaproteobacteria bacterium]PZO35728.1 MAG: hypothetical protein DCE92_09975 [Alphaproteobacteria bacterium]